MSAEPWRYDSSCLHLRWQGQQSSRKPRIGVVFDDGLYTPFPPVRRAIQESAQKLRDSGVDVVELRLPNVAEAVGITYGMFALDGCQVSTFDTTQALANAFQLSLSKISSRQARSRKSSLSRGST